VISLLTRELVSRAKLCLVSVFPDIVKDCPKIRNLPKKFRECGPIFSDIVILPSIYNEFVRLPGFRDSRA